MAAPCGEPVHNSVVIECAGVLDAGGVAAAPGVVLLEGGRLRAAGSPEAVGMPPAGSTRIARHDLLAMPGLVNAHAHLDLSGPGIWPPAGDDFRGWVGRVRALRQAQGADDRRAAVRRGIELSLAGGTTCIGDIAGGPRGDAVELLQASTLRGVSYVEFFGIGDGAESAAEAMAAVCGRWSERVGGVTVGLSPHAPYSCDTTVYRAAARHGRPVATHLAETRAEVELLTSGSGPLRDMLEHDIGVWSPSVRVPGRHPAEEVLAPLGAAGGAAVHGNWLEAAHVDDMVAAGIALVFCPRASAAFGHAPPDLPQHPWAAYRAAGGTVALGTDSLLCLDTPDRISVLDDMRLLAGRDAVEPQVLLSMATTAGAAVLGLEPGVAALASEAAGVIGCRIGRNRGNDPWSLLATVLARTDAPEWLAPPRRPA